MEIEFLQGFLLISSFLLVRENIQRFSKKHRMHRLYSWLYVISNAGVTIDLILLAIYPILMKHFPSFRNYILGVLVITWGSFWTGSLQAEIIRQELDLKYQGIPLTKKYKKDKIVRNIAVLLILFIYVCALLIYTNL